jgi:hypothetical protein
MIVLTARSDCRFCALTPTVVDDSIESRFGQRDRSGAANSRGRTRNQRYFSGLHLVFLLAGSV